MLTPGVPDTTRASRPRSGALPITSARMANMLSLLDEADGSHSVEVEAFSLVSEDIFQSIDDPSAELEKRWTDTSPAPPFECPRREPPSDGKLLLVQKTLRHFPSLLEFALLRAGPLDCSDFRRCYGSRIWTAEKSHVTFSDWKPLTWPQQRALGVTFDARSRDISRNSD